MVIRSYGCICFKHAFFVALITLASIQLDAEELDWLYDVVLPIESQSESERVRALRVGFEIVLHRVTGLRELPKSAPLDEAFRNLNSYQLQLRYDDSQSSVHSESKLKLIISFDRSAIHDLIRAADLPVWSAQRPHVLFLVSSVDHNTRTVLTSSLNNDLVSELRETAAVRGISFSLPIMDFDDRYILREGTLAFKFLDRRSDLSKRFRADVVVEARIDELELKNQRVWWTMYEESSTRELIFDIATAQDAVAEIVHKTADVFAKRYAVFGEVAALYMGVSGIADVADYKNLLDYLQKWEFVDLVLLRVAAGDRLELELRTSSTWEQFNHHLEADGALTHKAVENTDAEGMRELVWHKRTGVQIE